VPDAVRPSPSLAPPSPRRSPCPRPSAKQGALAALLAAGAIAAAGCATGKKLEVKKVDASVQKPANVALYLQVSRQTGEAVALVTPDFAVYEDGKVVSAKKAGRALLPVRQAVDRFLVLAVDLSGPLVDSEYLPSLLEAVDTFGGRMVKQTRVGLGVFDGDGLVPLVGFADDDPQTGLAALRKFRPRNRNVDLWGSFLTALTNLEEATGKSPMRHRQAIMILVTDRKDKAGRHSLDEVVARVQKTSAEVFVIGIGDAISREELERVGKTGHYFVEHPREIDRPFQELAERLEGKFGQDYLFSYCSPKRKGNHDVEVRIQSPQWRGTVSHSFSAKGFASGCDPKAKPSFDIEGAAAKEDDAEDAEDDKAPPSKGKKKKKKAAADEEDES
jgi:hypothetical protein